MTADSRKPSPGAAILPQDDGLQPLKIAAAISSTPPAAWLAQPQKTHEDIEMQESAPQVAPHETIRTKPRATVPMLSPEGRERAAKTQAEIIKTIGGRMREARELSNLSLSEAARRLGYANPSKLSKVENATDTNSVPLRLIRDAAELYDVSADYIFGLADDWETGIPRGMTGWLADRWEQQRRRDIAAMAALGARVDACAELIPGIAADAREVLDAVRRLDALNPDAWPEIRGGGRLNSAAERLERNARAAAEAEKRLKIELTTATTEDEQ